MRYGPSMAGLVALSAPAHADSRSQYVTMVLQAFAAKVECPGTDVVYQDLVQKAQEMHLPEGTTEHVRQAIAFMHTGGKMGERQTDDLMMEVAVATRSTDMDQALRHDHLVRDSEDEACRVRSHEELRP